MIPTPNPMAAALIRFCTGYTSDRAVMASSLICATKKLSTILYREFTSMEIIIGRAMDKISGNTGFSFINVSFIFYHPPFFDLLFPPEFPFPPQCGPRGAPLFSREQNFLPHKKTPHNHKNSDCVAKKAVKLKNPHEILA